MSNIARKTGVGVTAALAAGLIANQPAMAETQAPVRITGTETPIRADDGGCDAECIEAVIQVLRFAYHVVTQQYEQDKARCKEVYAYQDKEEAECISRAFNKGVRHFIILGGGTGSMIYLGHNMHRITRMKDDFMGLFKRSPKETELTMDTPEYPKRPETKSAGVRPVLHDDIMSRVGKGADRKPEHRI